MRKIKFRAWLKNEKKMVDVLYIDFDVKMIVFYNQDEEYEDVIREEFAPFDAINLIQYTGLKDKNGVEIYEGDVFIYEDGCIGVVRYSEQYAWFIIEWYENSHSKEPIDDDPLGNINIHNMEVIGNIYDNPELLQ